MENFRMSRSTFLYLCDEIRSTVERQDTILRKAVPTDKRVALTLWFLATGADFRTIAHLYQSPPFQWDVSSTILQLLPRYIRFPTGDALKEVVAGFKTVWFAQALLMELIFLLCHQPNAQPTTTIVRDGIPLFYKVQWTTMVILLTSM